MDRPVIVLDVNETVSDLSTLADAFEEHGAPAALVTTWFASTLRDGFALTITGETRPFTDVARAALVGLLSHESSLRSNPERAADAILSAFAALPPHNDIAPGIAAAAAAGHRIVTLSNGTADAARALLVRAGVAELADRHLGVEDTGWWKPHPEAYRRALELLGVAPADAILTAVHPWDLHGARRAGLRTAFVNRTDAPWPKGFDRPDIMIATLVELPVVLS